MEPIIPRIGLGFDERLRWPCWKYGMRLDELFTTLHTEFNTWRAPLQTFEAFHHDVWELSNTATTRDELFRALAERRKQREEEMGEAWNNIAERLALGHSVLPKACLAYIIRFFRTRSLDSMLAFLYNLLSDEDKKEIHVIDIGRPEADKAKQTDDGLQANIATPPQRNEAPDGLGEKNVNYPNQGHSGDAAQPVETVEEGQAASGTIEEVASDKAQNNKHASRSPVSSFNSPVVNLGPQRSRNRVSKKRASTRRPSKTHANRRVTEEPAAQSSYNLRPRAPRKAR
ncbi:hypothetical protein F5Y10DRAFT_290143 [Nemania abortiva]|nr:hypothetical protein F5Y10DRAFT_290143 [Nemania abortiva]